MIKSPSIVVLVLVGAGCALPSASPPPDDEELDTGYPAPRTDLVPSLGAVNALDLAAWNVRFFPSTEETPSLVADVVASLALDLVAVAEVTNVDAFDELVARLPEHEGLLSTHSYGSDDFPDQKLAFLYRSSVLTLEDSQLLFTGNDFIFPRPPLAATFTYQEGDRDPFIFTAIAVHQKAGREDEDYERRREALADLEPHVRGLVDGGTSAVVLLGDFNEDVFGAREDVNWAPFASSPDRYSFLTKALAEAGEATFIPGNVFIDHIVATTAFAEADPTARAIVPRLQFDVVGYQDTISDHLPVVLGHP